MRKVESESALSGIVRADDDSDLSGMAREDDSKYSGMLLAVNSDSD